MIKPVCARCGDELVEPGGIHLSRPTSTRIVGMVAKRHLCDTCDQAVIEFIDFAPRED